MTDILDDLRNVEITGGNTYSSYEVIGMVGRARQEIERLKTALREIAEHRGYGTEIALMSRARAALEQK